VASKVHASSKYLKVCPESVNEMICAPALLTTGSRGTPPAAGSWLKAGLSPPRVVVKIGITTAYGAPVEGALIIHVGVLGEHPIQRDRLTRAGSEDPRHAVGQPIGMAGTTATPRIVGLLAPQAQRHDITDRHVKEPINRDAQGREEGLRAIARSDARLLCTG